MNDLVISTYQTLMANLATIPAEIALAQSELTTIKMTLAKTDGEISAFELSQSLTVEGKNAEERKAKLAETLRTNQAYQAWQRKATAERIDAAKLANDVDNLTRQFTAVGFQARLHSGLMNYLAAAGAVSPDIDLGGSQQQTNGHANGHATAEDAAAIGL